MCYFRLDCLRKYKFCFPLSHTLSELENRRTSKNEENKAREQNQEEGEEREEVVVGSDV